MLIIKENERMPVGEIIPTPSFGLNYALGGGLETGRFHILWGGYSAGKSTMAYQMAATAQQMGYFVVIVDSELSFSEVWADLNGIDPSQRTVLSTQIAEELLKELLPILKAKEKVFLIIDSVNSITSEDFYKKDDKGHQIGIDAKSRKFVMQKIAGYLDKDKIAIMVAQQTTFITSTYSSITAKIGRAEEHWAGNIIKLFSSTASDSQVREGKAEDKFGGTILDTEIRWTIDKSKQRPVKGRRGAYWFSQQSGYINAERECLTIAMLNGIIERRGSWFFYKDKKAQGGESLIDLLTEEEIEEIKLEMSSKVELILGENDSTEPEEKENEI